MIPVPALPDLNDGDPIIDMIKSRCRIDPETNCWLWLGAKSEGYGCLTDPTEARPGYARLTQYAHRLACARSYGVEYDEVPTHVQAQHQCVPAVRRCANPDHLRFGPARLNTRDAVEAGSIPWAFTTGVCQRGHDVSDPYITPDGRRNCRTCRAIAAKKAEANRKPRTKRTDRNLPQRKTS